MHQRNLAIMYLLLVAMLLGGCATGNPGQTGASQGPWPASPNETPGPGKGPSGRY